MVNIARGGTRERLGVLLALHTAIAATGCVPDAPSTTASKAPNRWDSAGVAIVESMHPSLTGESWVFVRDPVPRVTSGPIREMLTTDAPLVSGIVAGAVVGTSARLLVLAMRGPPRVFAYGPGGNLEFEYSRLGEGPGELMNVSDVAAYRGDSVAVLDLRKQALIVLSSSGEFGREVSLAFPSEKLTRVTRIAAALPDGSIRLSGLGRSGGSLGRQVLPLRVVTVDEEGRYVGVVLQAPGREIFYTRADNGVVWAEPLFARRSFISKWGTAFAHAHGSRLAFSVYDSTGALRLIGRRLTTPRDYSNRDVQRAIDAKIAGRPDPGGEVASAQLGMIEHRTLPEIAGIWVDENTNRIWLQRYQVPGEAVDSALVFDERGSWLTTVALPTTGRLLLIDDDMLFIVETRADGTDEVVVYRHLVRR